MRYVKYYISLGQGGRYTEEHCKGGVGCIMSMLDAALLGFMNGQKGAEKGGSFGSGGDIFN